MAIFLRKLYQAALLCALPALALGLLLVDRYARPGFAGTWPVFIAILATAYATALAFAFVFFRASLRHVGGLQEQIRRALAQMRELQTRIDFLTAEREISLLLNESLDFETITDRVLALACDLTSATKTEVYLRNGDAGLHLAARRVNGRTEFPANGTPGDEVVESAYQRGSVAFASQDERLTVAAPLAHDREMMGVLCMDLTLEEGEERVQLLARHLDEFAKFVSLAFKAKDLYRRAIEDGLTGLATKRHFLSQLENYFEMSRRHNEPLSLVMIDIDHFKKINDTYGHLTGDLVLKGVAAILQKSVRRHGDLAHNAYRYGGEEMSLILPKTPADKAVKAAERVRKAIESARFQTQDGRSLKVTASFGVAERTREATIQELIEKADRALYRAKQEGRNRVCIEP